MDRTIFFQLYGGSGAWLWAMAALTVIGSGWTMFPIAGLAYFRRTRAHALRLTALLVGVAALVFSLKALVRRPRPCAALAHVHALVFGTPHDWSFPSGHAAGAFTVATFVALETRLHPALKAALFVVAAGIGCSRVVLGMHFPGDVAAGAVLGVVASAAFSRWRWGRAQGPLDSTT